MSPGLKVAGLVLLSAGTLAGDEVWSWHSFDVALLKERRVEWTLHTRLRTREGELQQGRSGTIVRVAAHARFTVIGGYYYGREEDTRQEWQHSHRVFGGAEIPVYRWKGGTVAARGLVERFLVEDRASFTRLRHRVRLTTNGRMGPYASGEWFWDVMGYLAGRYQGGVRWRGLTWASVEIGYMYDARSPHLGSPRHGVVTQFVFEPRREM